MQNLDLFLSMVAKMDFMNIKEVQFAFFKVSARATLLKRAEKNKEKHKNGTLIVAN